MQALLKLSDVIVIEEKIIWSFSHPCPSRNTPVWTALAKFCSEVSDCFHWVKYLANT